MKRISFTTQIALAMAAAVLTGLALQFFGCEAWADRLFAPGGRIFDMGRTVLNIVGDTTAATVIGVSRR